MGPGVVAVLHHVAGAVDTRSFSIPDGEHTVDVGAGNRLELLGAPDGGGGEILIDAGLKDDSMLVEMGLGLPQRRVVTADG